MILKSEDLPVVSTVRPRGNWLVRKYTDSYPFICDAINFCHKQEFFFTRL